MSRAVTEVSIDKGMSPEEATAKLAEMSAAYRQATPAADKLAALLGDKETLRAMEYGGAHGSSDGRALPGGPVFDRVQQAVAEARAEGGGPVNLAMAGVLGD